MTYLAGLLNIGVKGLFFDDMIGWMMAGCVSYWPIAEKEGDQQKMAYTIGEMLVGLAGFLALCQASRDIPPPRPRCLNINAFQ